LGPVYGGYRIGADDPNTVRTAVGAVVVSPGTTEFTLVDLEELPNARFIYFIVAEFNDGPPAIISGPSNAVTILAVNDAPAAVSDPDASGGRYTTDQGTPLVIAASGLLRNDSDADSVRLTARIAAGASGGSVTVNGDGSFVYTPNPGCDRHARF